MFPALSKIIFSKKDFFVILLVFIFGLVSLMIHPFWLTGDTPTYLKSIEFLKGNFHGTNFLPFRIISTYLALNILIIGEKIFGNVFFVWTLMNLSFYVMAGYFMYKIIQEVYESERTALIGMLLLVSNYAVVIHGLAFALDLGGWAFYLASIYFSLRHIKTGNLSSILLASIMIGVGSLLKEYAFGGYPVMLGAIIYYNYGDWRKIFKLVFIGSILSFLPAAILHAGIYFEFHYTYLDWYKEQRYQYGGTYYTSRVVEYIKSFGAVYGVGWLLFLSSMFLLLKSKFSLLDKKFLFYLFTLFISASPVFFWPGIVPRTVFIMIPFAITISCLVVKKFERRWYLFLPVIVVYIAWSYLLDKYIFDLMNIDSVLKYILFWVY